MSSFANVTELWKYAAVLMGESPATAVLDATNPTRPIEVTFDTVYDSVRRMELGRLKPRFAIEFERLREAPTIAWDGDVFDWEQRGFEYIYRPPFRALALLGFQSDDDPANLTAPFMTRQLPIRYARSVFSVDAGGNLRDAASAWNGYVWRDSIYGVFHSDNNEGRYEIGIADSGLLPAASSFVFTYEGVFEEAYSGFLSNPLSGFNFVTPGTPRLDYTDVIADTGMSVLDDTVIEYGYGNPYQLDSRAAGATSDDTLFTSHIYTNVEPDEADAVFLADHEIVSEWTEEFAHLVASVLAERAARVHAKSTKMLNLLRDERTLATNDAAVRENDQSGGLRRSYSTAEQSRR